MKLTKLSKILKQKYNDRIYAVEEHNCIVLKGKTDNYQEIIEAGYLAVDKKRYIGVLNDVELLGFKEEIVQPSINNLDLDNKEVDVLVIGAGISGASVTRELSRYKLNILVIDKESDFALHTSSRNDGQVHPGVDLNPGSLKQHYVLEGNKAYDRISKELDFEFIRRGQYALFDQPLLRPILWVFSKIRCKQGSICSIVERKDILKVEPNIADNVKFALYSPSAGVVAPFEVTTAYGENAYQNGVEFSFNTIVKDMILEDNKIVGVVTNKGVIKPRFVINCAGTFSEDIAKMANDRYFSIHPRKGNIFILDKKEVGLINTIASIKHLGDKNEKHSKGGGLIHLESDNILGGPTATETPYKEDYSTEIDQINRIYNKQVNTAPILKKGSIITYFSGTRAATFEEDFYIHEGRNTSNIFHVAGIQSPGITTAPVVAIDVASKVAKLMNAEKNPSFNPLRKGIVKVNKLSDEEKDKLIKKNPDYGIIICRCEQISKGEIIDALANPLCPPTIDAVKKRCRPGMGRCQGAFCGPLVAKIISEVRHIPLKEVYLKSAKSYISLGDNK